MNPQPPNKSVVLSRCASSIFAPVLYRSLRNLFLTSITLTGATITAKAGPLPLPQQGVYRGAVQTGRVDAYSTWLGQPNTWAVDFMANDDWSQVRGPSWIINPWKTWVAAQPGRRLILSVPLLPQPRAVNQAESVATSTASDAVSPVTDSAYSAGKGELLESDVATDYITYTIPNVPAGSYEVRVRYKSGANQGQFQTSIDGTNQGSVIDQYGATPAMVLTNLGLKSFTTTGNKVFRFAVTGKNAGSTGHQLTFDYIELQTTLGVGGTGAYNDHFRQLATTLVANGLEDSILRLGWEFNGGWYAWAASGKQTAFINYWRHIVDTMNSVPGANFEYCWNPTNGYLQFPAEQAWPGDAYVDYVGLDLYDQSWLKDANGAFYYNWPANATAADIEARRAKVWKDDLLDGNRGLTFWKNFTVAHGKQFVLPEWGVMNRADGYGGKDNAAFIANMHNFITTYPVAWAAYFDYNNTTAASQISPGSQHPAAQAKFLELFSGELLSETFEDNVADGWTASPAARWSIVTDSGDKAYKFDFDWSNQSGTSTAGNAAWTNVTLTADFKLTDVPTWSDAYFYIRYVDDNNFYQLVVQDTGGTRRFQLRKKVAGTITELALGSATVNVGTWYTVSFSATGSTLTARFNGTQVIQFTDTAISAGKVGLGARKLDVLFDNVTVN